jgi:hypothetical protein
LMLLILGGFPPECAHFVNAVERLSLGLSMRIAHGARREPSGPE